ncbi:hypothetical protein D3C72_1979150 [compost metagenome]
MTVSVTSVTCTAPPGAAEAEAATAGLACAAVAPRPLCQKATPITNMITSAINATRKPRAKFCWLSSLFMEARSP